MNKKVIIILFMFIAFFTFTKNVNAFSCAKIDEKIDKYISYKDKLDNVDCTDTTDAETVSICNSYTMEKNALATQLMKINDEDGACASNKSEVKKIAKENEEKCGKIFDDDLTNLVNKIMTIFYIIGPILLILLGTIDYTKATISSDEKMLKRANQRFLRRMIATVLLLLSPVLVNLILSFNISDYYLSGNAYSCDFEYYVYNEQYNIRYVPKITYNSNGTSSGITEGGITSDAEMEELSEELTSMLNTTIHVGTGQNQSGPFPSYWTTPINQLSKFQCTWWANGRASQYLSEHGTKYKTYPTQTGHGGQYFSINKKNGYFKYGQTPKANSIISWTKSGGYGHVAYVEGVTNDAIYISHAGSGKSWRGVEKISVTGDIGWSGYKLNGFIYLDEPIE